MDFLPDEGLETFRHEIKAFLRQHLPDDLVGHGLTARSSRPRALRWQAICHAHGLAAPYWPQEHGGPGWSVAQILVFDEECVRAGAPRLDVFGHKLLGPVLNEFGTAAQREEHLGPMLRGETLWCQGFSEPGAGSDLASLRTRAVRADDDYIITGQKIWTSNAHNADRIFVLARTEQSQRKHDGISFLLVDLKSPGVTIRPIYSIDGCHHLNEVFFDGVRVPDRQRVGREGQGWSITKFLLNNEHATTAQLPVLQRYVDRIEQLARTQRVGTALLGTRPEFRLRYGQLKAELLAVRMMVERVAALDQEHAPFGAVLGSMLKIRSTELQQRFSAFMVEVLGDYGAIAYPGEDSDASHTAALPLQELAHGISSEMFFRRAATIYGGSSEVQREIIAKRHLGL
jgi:acyl-CoA dehydrogenase